MGWFSKLVSSASRAVSSVASSVVSSASKAWETAKNVAGKAVEWMAEKADGMVQNITKTWETMKPYVQKSRTYIQMAAQLMPIPWLKVALKTLDKSIEALFAFENSPIAKKVKEAIAWSINLAKRWQVNNKPEKQQEVQEKSTLSDEELMEAKRHQKEMRFAEREVFPDDIKHELGLASAINDYEIAKADLTNAISVQPENFEHYLRLRATQKLLAMADKKFRSAQSLEDIDSEDIFLVRIASDLIKSNPELSQEAAERLDRILHARYRKKLTPFIFEEMIASWAKKSEMLEQQWHASNKEFSKDKVLHKKLIFSKKIESQLSTEEETLLQQLESEIPRKKEALDQIATEKDDMDRYVGAAEGFLQVLEKSHEDIIAEDREYLIESGVQAGRILIDCAENNKQFALLSEDDQMLIINYSNIFKNESELRMQNILEVQA